MFEDQKQNINEKTKRSSRSKKEKSNISFGQKVLGTFSLGLLGTFWYNRKESKIERTKKDVELYKLEKNLPWFRKHKYATYLGVGLIAYSLVACPENYGKTISSLRNDFHQSFRTSVESGVEIVKSGAQLIESRRKNQYESKIKEIQEQTKKLIDKVESNYDKTIKQKEELSESNTHLQELLTDKEKKLSELLRQRNNYLSSNSNSSNRNSSSGSFSFSRTITSHKSPVRNLEKVISRDDYIEVVVQRGDSISALASKIYSGSMNTDFFDRLGDYNGIENENLIYPGQVLKFPKDTKVLYQQ